MSYFYFKTIVSFREAIFLDKLHYWLKKCNKKTDNLHSNWIYNPIREWAKQLNCSISTIKRVIYSLEKKEIIFSEKKRAKRGDHTKWYTINYPKVSRLLDEKKNNNKILNSENKWDIPFVQSGLTITNNKNYNKNNSSIKYKKELSIKMIYLWNKIFEYSLSPIKAYHNDKISKKLFFLLRNNFANDLNKWQEYAKAVNSSQFLMGEKKTTTNFKAVFSWLIQEDTVKAIMSGAYGVGDREIDMNRINKNLKKQENNLLYLIQDKIVNYIEDDVINHQEEKKEFAKYIINKNDFVNDDYGFKRTLQYYDSYSLLNFDCCSKIKNTLYKGYLLKKHLGFTILEIQKEIMKKINNIKHNKNCAEAFKVLQKEMKKIKNIYVNKNNVFNFFCRINDS